MKQHITVEQLQELSIKARIKLVEWCKKHDPEVVEEVTDLTYYEEPILSIGQMIEYQSRKNNNGWVQLKEETDGGWIDPETLCDALWQAVKEDLEA